MNFDSALSRIDYSNYQKWDHCRYPTVVPVAIRWGDILCAPWQKKMVSISSVRLSLFDHTINFRCNSSSGNRCLIYILLCDIKQCDFHISVIVTKVSQASWRLQHTAKFSGDNVENYFNSSYLTHKCCLIMTFVWKYDERENKIWKLETLSTLPSFCCQFLTLFHFFPSVGLLKTSIFLNQSNFSALPSLSLSSLALFFTLSFIAVAQLLQCIQITLLHPC